MGMQPHAWMMRWLFESSIFHNSFVKLEVVKISIESGLNIFSLPSHTSHEVQLIDVTCLKPFKTTFRKLREIWSLTTKNKVVGKQA